LGFGFDHHEAVMVIYAIQADLFLLAYWLRFESDLTILAVVSAFFLAAIALFQIAARRHWRLRSAEPPGALSPLARFIEMLREPRSLPRWSYLAIAVSVCVYATIVIATIDQVGKDIRWLLLALLAVATVWPVIWRSESLGTVERAGLYITATVLVYLDTTNSHDLPALNLAIWAVIATMAVGILLRLRLSQDRRFELTPLDLIVLFVALVIPSLPGTFGLPNGGALGIAKLVILFYAIEALLSRSETRVIGIRMVAALVLLGLTSRIWF
jgi:UDP-GlcNAc:undecaprenyl-phosphate GlcNAc-1-phosphate transferase